MSGLPPGAIGFLQATVPFQDAASFVGIVEAWRRLSERVRKGELCAYVLDHTGQCHAATPAQFASLGERDPSCIIELATGTGTNVRGMCFFMADDLAKILVAGTKARRPRSKFQAAEEALRAAFPQGIPSKEEMPNQEIFRRADKHLRQGLKISDSTWLRASNRK